MDVEYEKKYHRLEEDHWWFRGRRDILLQLVDKLNIKTDAAVLEIGCSGGALMAQLKKKGFTDIKGIDTSQVAVELAGERGIENVWVMDGARLNFNDNSFELLIASDVLEHIKDHEAALREWYRVLKPGGRLIIFVPAFQFLWSAHDVANHHFRRYNMKTLTRLVQDAGFTIQRRSFWNAGLFPVTLLVRFIQNKFYRRSKPADNLKAVNQTLNKALFNLLKTENRLLKQINFPLGVSLFVVCSKEAG